MARFKRSFAWTIPSTREAAPRHRETGEVRVGNHRRFRTVIAVFKTRFHAHRQRSGVACHTSTHPASTAPTVGRKPAGTPLPGPVQLQVTELNLDNVTVQGRRHTVFWEDRYLLRLGPSILEHLDRFTPGRFLTAVDLPQIQPGL
ncbi:MAG: hypothetical protein ACREX4_17645 [Gammaproteobacteria bacterium]